MSALEQRSDQRPANDSEWLEFPGRLEISPESVWAPDYDEEISLQSKRVAAKRLEQVTARTIDEPSVGEARPQARMLDESQVLASEASFATVTLNQPLEPTAVNGRAQVTASRGEEFVNPAGPRTRILDESQVLPGEASFATMVLNAPIAARTYSPLAEFFAKSDLAWRRLAVAALLLVSFSAAIAMVALRIARQGVFSSHRTISTSADTSRPKAEPTAAQTESPTSKSVVSAAVSNRQTEVKEPKASAPQNAAKLEAAVETARDKSRVSLNSERSLKAGSDEIKLKTPRKTSQQEAKSGTRNSVSAGESSKRGPTTQQRRASVKESKVSRRAAHTERVNVNNPRAQTVGASRESSSLSTSAAAGRPKDASTSAPVTGGGQRPRTVLPKVNP